MTNALCRETWALGNFDLWEDRLTQGGGAWGIAVVGDHLEITRTGGVAGNGLDKDQITNTINQTGSIWRRAFIGNGSSATSGGAITLPIAIPIAFEITTWPSDSSANAHAFALVRFVNSSLALTGSAIALQGRAGTDLRINFDGTGSSITLSTATRYHALIEATSTTITLTLWLSDGTFVGQISKAHTFSTDPHGYRIGAMPLLPTFNWHTADAAQVDVYVNGFDDSYSDADTPTGRDVWPISADGGLMAPNSDATPNEWDISGGSGARHDLVDDYDPDGDGVADGSPDGDTTAVESTNSVASDPITEQFGLPNYGGSLDVLTISAVFVSKDTVVSGANHGRGFNSDGNQYTGVRNDANVATASYEWHGICSYDDETDTLWAIDAGAPGMPNVFMDRNSPGGVTQRRLTAVAVIAEEYDPTLVIEEPPVSERRRYGAVA